MAGKQGRWPVNTKLRAQVVELLDEIAKLQCALNFWLPCVPEGAAEGPLMDRVFNDANLLAGYGGPMVETAEELGWITLNGERSTPASSENPG